MKLSLQITSRNFELTDAIKAEITEKVEKLENFCDQILKCRVVVESPHRHSHDGRLYNVNIDLKIPGTENVREVENGEYSRVAIPGFADVLCFNDKLSQPGMPVFLSVRPEKIRISRERPAADARHNSFAARVDDVVYLGTHTRFWVRVGGHRLAVFQQQGRFMLDERPIRWSEEVWVSWHADDGSMLERYSESDEQLMGTPPEEVGEADAGGETAATGSHGG